MEKLWQDIRFGLRMLWKNRAFSAIAILALAIGIGANSAIFSVINAVLLRPLPYNEPDRLVFLYETNPQIDNMSVAYPNLLDWRAQNTVFEQLGGYRRQSYNLTGEFEPQRLLGGQVSANIFPMLGVKPLLGRGFNEDEDRPGSPSVVILSHGLWERNFGRDPDIINRSISLNSTAYTVIGVMPKDFRFPSSVDLWTAIGTNGSSPNWVRGNHPGIYAIGRLKPGINLEQAQSAMNGVAVNLEKQYPDSNSNNRVGMKFLLDRFVGELRPILYTLLAAVVAVLLIACVNVANLLLSRATARQKEIAIRSALGASRWRIIRQLLTESVILSLAGGLIGVILAMWGTSLLLSLSSVSSLPRFQDIHVDGTVLLFTFSLSLITGILFGLAPAFQTSKLDLNETLKEGGRNAMQGIRHNRLRSTFVIAETAIALVLLIGAGLLMRSFISLQKVDAGFDAQNVLTMGIALPSTKYKTEADHMQFFDQLITRVKALPGVQHAAIVNDLPIESGNQTSFYVEGTPQPNKGEEPLTEYNIITPEYFATMGIQLVRGRNFTDADREKSEKVVIIDENFAKQFWPNQDPLGKRVKMGGYSSTSEWCNVVGIARNIKFEGLDATDQRVLSYTPYPQAAIGGMVLVIRTANDPAGLTSAVRSEVFNIDREQPIYLERTMQRVVEESLAGRKLTTTLTGIFSMVALLLAAVGIYGVMSYGVTQRTHEIGIRMALGAQTADVLMMVLKQGMLLTIIGVGIGLVMAFALTRTMSSLLFGISATDPITFTLIPLLLIVISVLACYVPARRATKVDPMVALRYE